MPSAPTHLTIQPARPATPTIPEPKVVSLRRWKLLNGGPLPLSEAEIKDRMALSKMRRPHHPDLQNEPGARKPARRRRQTQDEALEEFNRVCRSWGRPNYSFDYDPNDAA